MTTTSASLTIGIPSQSPTSSSTKTIGSYPVARHALGTHEDGASNMNNVNLNENPVARELGQPASTAY